MYADVRVKIPDEKGRVTGKQSKGQHTFIIN